MTQQSLEELSSIYSEASELGLTSLGVIQPRQGSEEDQGLVQDSAAMVMAAEEKLDSGGGSCYYSDQDIMQHSAASMSAEAKLEPREPEDYYSDQETVHHDPEALLQQHREMEDYYSDQGNAEVGGPRKKRRTNYSYIPEDIKRKVVNYAKIQGSRPAARLFNISEGAIRSWKMRGFNKPTSTIARGRKVTYGQDLDDELYLGLMAMISEQEIITVDQFTEYAKKIIVERRPDLNFKCSRGWMDKFLSRHKLGVTKSDAAKVMHIVEQSEVVKSPSKGLPSLYHHPNDACFGRVESNMEVVADESPETNLTLAHGIGTSDSPPGLERHDSSENGSLTPLCGKPGYNSYLPSGEINEALSEREQKKQRDAAKSMHVRDIMGKLDVISGSSDTTCIDEQQRLEVVKHAHLHGSKSAEKKYGVPETTINFWLQKTQISSEQATPVMQNAATTVKEVPVPVPVERTLVMQGARVSIPNQNIMVTQSSAKLPTSVNEHLYVRQGAKVPVSNKHMYVAQGGTAANQTFILQGASMPVQKEQTFAMQGRGMPVQNDRTFVAQGAATQVPIVTHEEVYITQAGHHRATASNTSLPVNCLGGRRGPPQPVSVANASPGASSGGTEVKVLAWALEQRRSGQEVTFDGLCDQALGFVSQDNPGSAYSSTRKWVDKFLNLKVRDLLNVKM